jgi:hypothetical protein
MLLLASWQTTKLAEHLDAGRIFVIDDTSVMCYSFTIHKDLKK